MKRLRAPLICAALLLAACLESEPEEDSCVVACRDAADRATCYANCVARRPDRDAPGGDDALRSSASAAPEGVPAK
jgi:hypothetical protein